MANPNLDNLWATKLQPLFSSPEMRSLRAFLQAQKKLNKQVFPPTNLTFNALNLTPFDNIKVVILGQDPYHGEGQAHGLCFSVPPGITTPPSLRNIFGELKSDLGIERTLTDLTDWAKQGVLMLNSVLTVEKQQAASHA
ncbi:MAG: uracil-DNA glycosylase, partial [Gammaproteobacteria bacterium]|nr:uracil-DNA glycosylase [Gammaproteobacteria bacterium]